MPDLGVVITMLKLLARALGFSQTDVDSFTVPLEKYLELLEPHRFWIEVDLIIGGLLEGELPNFEQVIA